MSTGNASNGFLGFSTIDDSNGQGIRDAGRIAIVNESGAARNSPTALGFWTNAGGTNTTAATERMRITSDGNVGIGITAPAGRFHSTGDFIQQTSIESNQAFYFQIRKSRGSVDAPTAVVSNNDIIGGLLLLGYTGTGWYSGAAIRAEVDGTVTSTTVPMNLKFFTGAGAPSGGTERMRITSDGYLRLAGAGIQFNGDTAAANSLDDYEEGTWTPVLDATTSATGVTYSTQTGTYTKIGRLVTFAGTITLSNKGTLSGYLKITGLPFQPANPPTSKPAVTFAYNTNITTIPVSDVFSTNSFMYLYKVSQTASTSITQLSTGDINNDTIWNVNGQYYV